MNHLQRMKDKNRKNYNKCSTPRPGRCRTLLRLTTFCLKHRAIEEQESSHKIKVSLSVSFRAVVQCVLQFNFMAAQYNGIIALQDALTVKKMLHKMEAKAEYINSAAGKFLM